MENIYHQIDRLCHREVHTGTLDKKLRYMSCDKRSSTHNMDSRDTPYFLPGSSQILLFVDHLSIDHRSDKR